MSQKKILVISSDPVLVDLVQKNLSEEGYRVICVAENTGEIDSALAVEQPDLVIVDIMLPGLEGVRVSLNIRMKYDVPIIMITSRLAETNEVRGLDLSAENYLSNSLNVMQLTGWIKETFTRNAAMSYPEPYHNGNGNGNGKKKLEGF